MRIKYLIRTEKQEIFRIVALPDDGMKRNSLFVSPPPDTSTGAGWRRAPSGCPAKNKNETDNVKAYRKGDSADESSARAHAAENTKTY